MMTRVILLTLSVYSSLFAGISTQQEYFSPTEQLIKRDSRERIEEKLEKRKVPAHFIPFFDAIAAEEDWGHIGYHAANQSFRIYQDIIRFTIEEIIGIPIREDFHLFRLPGDLDLNLDTMDAFTEYWKGQVNNKDSLRAKQLLSLNYSIYSNYDNKGSSSLYLFMKDKSKHDVDYVEQLTPFYEELGLSSIELDYLFAIAYAWLDSHGGVLFRIAEESHLYHPEGEAYNFADAQGYPAKRGGYRYGKYPLSNHFDRMMTNLYVEGDLAISPQLRLLLNNRNTLNPNSCLKIKRWDLYDKETITHYESDMREAIRQFRYDPEQAEQYRIRLEKLWQ